jgi:hypothetical protein
MIICTKCGFINRNDSGPYCSGGCGHTLNVVLCEQGHKNPPNVRACATCNDFVLTPHAVGIPIGWAPKVISALILIGLIRTGLAHGGEIGNALWVGASYSFAFLTGSDAGSLGNLLQLAFVWMVIIWVFGFLASLAFPSGTPGEAVGKALRNLPILTFKYVLRWTPKLLKALWVLTLRLFGLMKRAAPRKLSDKD